MTLLGKVGKTHGKHGMVKVIPLAGMDDMFSRINAAVVISPDGYKCEIENFRRYNRGRFIGSLKGFHTKKDVERFQGSVVFVE